MRILLFLILFFGVIETFGQKGNPKLNDSVAISQEQLNTTLQMLKDISTKGIAMINDSVVVSEKFHALVNDSNIRNEIYPKEYTWEQAIQYIQENDLKKAFWFLINLYPETEQNKKLVVKSVLSYDAVFKVDQVLINTFYTYAFADPESCMISGNTTEIVKPQILEAKLNTVKELVRYIHYYRANNINKTTTH